MTSDTKARGGVGMGDDRREGGQGRVGEPVAGDGCGLGELQPSVQGRTPPREPGLGLARAAPVNRWLGDVPGSVRSWCSVPLRWQWECGSPTLRQDKGVGTAVSSAAATAAS